MYKYTHMYWRHYHYFETTEKLVFFSTWFANETAILKNCIYKRSFIFYQELYKINSSPTHFWVTACALAYEYACTHTQKHPTSPPFLIPIVI